MATPDTGPATSLLLSQFAGFYEEVARIKQQATRGTLGDYLAQGGPPPSNPEALARATSARLAELMLTQRHSLRQRGTEAQLRLHGQASYLMAALADEVFIFELVWPAQQAWLSVLLEHRLFGSRLAGRRFFEQAQQVLASPTRDALSCDLACCFLLALQLGFKGMYRGDQGVAPLEALRLRLWRFVNGHSPPAYAPVLFPQAYAHTVCTHADPRLAPMAPWLRAARWWALGFLMLSSLLWLWLVQPLLRLSSG